MRPARFFLTLALCLTLSSLTETPPATAESGQPPAPLAQSSVKAALELADKGSFLAAQAMVAPFNSPLLDGLALWRAALADSQELTFWDIAVFLDRHPGWPQEGSVIEAAEKRIPDEIDDATLAIWFESYPPRSLEGVLRALSLYKAQQREEEAGTLAAKAWRELSMPADKEQAFLTAHGKRLSKDDHLQRLETLLWRRDAAGARRQAARLGGGYPALADARLKLALNEPGVDAAILAVPQALQDDPGLLYERAHWRLRRDRYDGVLEILYPPRPELTDPERWWRLRHWTAREALDRDDYVTAYEIAAQNGLQSGVAFAEAEWLAGWLALRFLDRPAAALVHFQRLYEGVGTPISKGRAAYWAGRAAEALGDREAEARRWYELAAQEATTFYGQLAAVRAGYHRIETLPAEATAAEPSDQSRQAFEERELVQVARLLGRYGEEDRIDGFIILLRSQAESGSDYRLLAELALEAGRTDLATLVAKSAQLAGIYLQDFLYPLPPVAPLPLDKLQQANPEAALVLALIRQESLFRRNAVSRAGARGLMQLMPGTAKKVAGELGLPYSGERLLDDGAYNMTLGSAYLKEMLERFGGSHILAVAAYNAGPARVEEWLDRFGYPGGGALDPVDWIERIPFGETRNYVQRVLEAMVVYRQRIGGEDALALQLSQDLEPRAKR